MKLMVELVEEVQYITEEKDGKKSVYIEGVFMQGAHKNRNGRVYPIEILESAVGTYNKDKVLTNRAYGELGHPAGPTINLERVCHMIKSLRKEGNDFIGKAKVLDTPYGNIVRNLIDEGASLGVSSRGLGSIKKNKDGIMEVQSDFFLSTAADVVADPSAHSAFVRGIMEDREWVLENDTFRPVTIDNWKKEIDSAVGTKRFDETQLKVFTEMMDLLSGKR